MSDDLPAVFLVEGESDNKRLKPYASPKVFAETNLERDIEAWVKNSMLAGVPVLGELVVFAHQPSYKASHARRPDLLALDVDRNVVVILAVRADWGAEQPERPMIEVQAKTMRHIRKPMWRMGAHWLAAAASPREWYVFVLLGEDVRQRPRCWVVPRDHAVAGAWIAHMHWRTEP